MRLLLTFGLAATSHALAVHLTDLQPVTVEYGMTNSPPEWKLQVGPGIIDMGSWGLHNASFWKDARKIVKAYPPDFRLPPGEPYKSEMPNAFAVDGEPVTGVGLWAKVNCMYHWLEYAIPTGAKRFTAKFYSTDDAAGVNFHINAENPANQDINLTILVDGKQVYHRHFQRYGYVPGGGQRLDTVALDLPPDAKNIRFHLDSTSFPNNINNEIVIHDGRFE
jgi:hypothetical protein